MSFYWSFRTCRFLFFGKGGFGQRVRFFYFNTILNRSSEWGVKPWHFYFSSLLPKSLLFAYPLSLLSIFLEKRIAPIYLITFGFVVLYSRLQHKEVSRIVFYYQLLLLLVCYLYMISLVFN